MQLWCDDTGLGEAANVEGASDRLSLALSSPLWTQRAARWPDAEAVKRAIEADATARRISAKGVRPGEGDRVGVRVNLNILKSTGLAVHSIHRGGDEARLMRGRGDWSGEVLCYEPVVTMHNVYFSVDQAGREKIAAGGGAKFPMASVDGAIGGEHSMDGIEVSFNPKRVHCFVDADGMAVRWASEVTVLGHRAYIRGQVAYYTVATAPRKVGNSPSEARFRA